jgi:hypothetical protein
MKLGVCAVTIAHRQILGDIAPYRFAIDPLPDGSEAGLHVLRADQRESGVARR